jgi:hypothetical protein
VRGEGIGRLGSSFYVRWIAHWGERDKRKNKDMEKEENIFSGGAHDLSATKLCTVISPADTKVALSRTRVALLAPKLLCELSLVTHLNYSVGHQNCSIGHQNCSTKVVSTVTKVAC